MEQEQALEQYILRHCSPESDMRSRVARAAHIKLVRPRMLSGHLQGNFLQMLVRLMQARYVLELGTYSGYAALSMAEALPEGGVVHTVECDDEMEDFIRHYIDESEQPNKVQLHIGDAMQLIPGLMGRIAFDIVYIDANKRQYPEYYEMIVPQLRSGALIIADNTLWDGKVIQPFLKESDVQTEAILRFNRMVQEDERVENLILPMRDGLSLIRVK